MKSNIIFASWVGVAVVGYTLGFYEGQRQIKLHTVVRLGTPFYQGVYFGACWKRDAVPQLAHGVMACATLEGNE